MVICALGMCICTVRISSVISRPERRHLSLLRTHSRLRLGNFLLKFTKGSVSKGNFKLLMLGNFAEVECRNIWISINHKDANGCCWKMYKNRVVLSCHVYDWIIRIKHQWVIR